MTASGAIRQDIKVAYHVYEHESRLLRWYITDTGLSTGTAASQTGRTFDLTIFDKQGGTLIATYSMSLADGNDTDDIVQYAWTATESTAVGGDGKYYYQVERTDTPEVKASGDFYILKQGA